MRYLFNIDSLFDRNKSRILSVFKIDFLLYAVDTPNHGPQFIKLFYYLLLSQKLNVDNENALD